MSKIPVGKTIEFAYEFTFGHLGTIIGLIWLPTVLSAVGSFFIQTFYYQTTLTAVTENRPAELGQAVISLFAWGVLAVLLSVIANVPVLRQALGLRKGPAYYHFALGPVEFRLFGAQMALFTIVGLFAIIYLFAVFALTGTVKAGGGAAAIAGLVLLAVVIVGLGFIVFAFVRLSFLLLPASLLEERIAISQSWTLTQGNFWRIFVIGLAVLGPLAIVSGLAQLLTIGPGYFADAMKQGNADQAQMAATQARVMLAHLPALVGVQLAIAPFMSGLMMGAAASAYRALVPVGTKLPV